MELNKENITKMIDTVVEKLKADDKLMAQFQKEPIKALEKILGIDLPDEQIQAVITGIKTKLKLDDIDLSKLDDLAGNLGKLFGKK